jgi:hypothetical protein
MTQEYDYGEYETYWKGPILDFNIQIFALYGSGPTDRIALL